MTRLENGKIDGVDWVGMLYAILETAISNYWPVGRHKNTAVQISVTCNCHSIAPR